MNKVIYLGNFNFPDGNAAGKRVLANSKILNELNYEVLIIDLKNINSRFSLCETKKELEGFECYSFSYPENNLEWVKYNKNFKKFLKFVNRKKIIDELEYIIYYGSPRISFFDKLLIDFCKDNNIKIISDCVDWLSVKTNNVFFDIFKWLDNTYQKAYLNNKVDGLITISNYLANYYEKNNKKTVIIPPLSSKNYELDLSSKYKSSDKIIISYAGIPFRKNIKIKDKTSLKDRIDKMIKIMYLLKKENIDFVFNIYGFTENEYFEVLPEQKKYVKYLENSIKFHGFTKNKLVIEKIMNSDYTILIRDIKRDTMAGFPTKISESLSVGTPVITNKTSDLADYIVEGETGFFISDNIEKSLKKLIKILSINKKEIINMKKKTIESNLFYYKKYISNMKQFLNQI